MIDTRERTPAEVAKAVAAVVYGKPYVEFDFDARLREIENGDLQVPKPEEVRVV